MSHTTFRMSGRRARVSLSVLVAIAALSVAALTGCTPTPAGTSAGTGTSGSPTKTNATPTKLTSPGGATCDTLASTAAVNAVFGTSDVTLAADSTNIYNLTPDIALLAVPVAGGLSCFWQDASSVSVSIAVLPNATVALAAAANDLASTDDATDSSQVAGVPQYGDKSWTSCVAGQSADGQPCQFDIQVGGYWIEAVISNYTGAEPNYPETATEQALLTGAVTAVKSFPKSPATWKAPKESYSAPASCDAAIPSTTIESTFGLTGVTVLPASSFIVKAFDAAASAAASVTSCSWGDASGATTVGYVLVPGSGALWSGTQGPPDAATVGLTTVAGLGSAAWQKCSDLGAGTECIAYILVGHSWLQLRYGSGVSITAATFDAFAKGVVGSLH